MFARLLVALSLSACFGVAGQAYGLGADLPADQVAQHGPHAVHGYFVNSVDVIFFHADTAGLNEYLADLAKKGEHRAVVVYHEGKTEARSPWMDLGTGKPADWSTTFNFRGPGIAQVDVWLGGQIDKAKVVLPDGVDVTDAIIKCPPADSTK